MMSESYCYNKYLLSPFSIYTNIVRVIFVFVHVTIFFNFYLFIYLFWNRKIIKLKNEEYKSIYCQAMETGLLLN